MAERIYQERLGPFPRLIPIQADFKRPWQEIVSDVNRELKGLRYRPYDPAMSHTAIFGRLDGKKSTPRRFDPVRVDFDLKEERYSPHERAVAHLGLQQRYWTDLAHELDTTRLHRLLHYEDYQQYSLIPVLTYRNRSYLIEATAVPEPTGIHFAGDGDMVSYAKSRAMRIDDAQIPFSDLGIHESILEEYIEFRKKIDKAETRAELTALDRFRHERQDIWNALSTVFSNIDEVFEARNYLSTIFFTEAKQLIESLFQSAQYAPELANLKQLLAVDLGSFLDRLVQQYYGRELLDNHANFYSSIVGLRKITGTMYRAALEELQWNAALANNG